jgi:hypothetical protein
VLWGCGGAPEREPPAKPQPTPQPVPAPGAGVDLRLPPSQFSAEFASAEQALAGFDWMSASVALEPLEQQALSIDDSTYLQYLRARIAYVRGEQDRALQDLAALEFPGINPALQ